jgi:3-oxoacyl-ACP reductase-like protein
MKSLWKSKTFWVNLVTVAAGVIGYLAGHDVIADNASLVALLVAVQGGVNVVLRLLTWQPVKV